jgi:hypothetical protein
MKQNVDRAVVGHLEKKWRKVTRTAGCKEFIKGKNGESEERKNLRA